MSAILIPATMNTNISADGTSLSTYELLMSDFKLREEARKLQEKLDKEARNLQEKLDKKARKAEMRRELGFWGGLFFGKILRKVEERTGERTI